MTHGPWKGPSTIPTTGISEIKTETPDGLERKSARKPLPPVLDGMDKTEALAYVSRLFDASEAGAVLWGDALLINRFISQCSRTGSKATQDGYKRTARVHALAGSQSPASASTRDQRGVLPGLGVPTEGRSRGRTHEDSNLQQANRCHQLAVSLGIRTKPLLSHRCAV